MHIKVKSVVWVYTQSIRNEGVGDVMFMIRSGSKTRAVERLRQLPEIAKYAGRGWISRRTFEYPGPLEAPKRTDEVYMYEVLKTVYKDGKVSGFILVDDPKFLGSRKVDIETV